MNKIITGIYNLTRAEETVFFVLTLTALGIFLVNEEIAIWKAVIVLVANILAVNFIYAINDVEDADDDALDPEKVGRNPVSAKLISKQQGYVAALVLAIIPLALYATVSVFVLISGFAFIAVGFLYSWKRVRLKSFPLIDLLSHGYFFAVGILLTTILAFGPLRAEIIIPVLAVYLQSMAGDLFNEIRDFEVDRKAKLHNTAQLIGLKTVIWLRYLFVGAAVTLAIYFVLTKIQLLFFPALVFTAGFIVVQTLINIYRTKKFKVNFQNSLYVDMLFVSISLLLFLSKFRV